MTLAARRRRSLPLALADDFNAPFDHPLHLGAGSMPRRGGTSTPWSATDGSTWAVAPAAATGGGPAANRVTGNGTLGVGAVLHADFARSDGVVSVTTQDITSDSLRMGIAFRFVNDSNFWAFFAYRASGGTRGYFLRSYVAGSTVFDSGFVTTGGRSGTVQLEVRLNGPNIDAYYDNVLRISTSSTTHQTATRHGLNADIGSGYRRFMFVPSFQDGDRPWPPHWNV